MTIREIGTNNQVHFGLNYAVHQNDKGAATTSGAEKKDTIDSAKTSRSYGACILDLLLSPVYLVGFVFKTIISTVTCGYFFSEKANDDLKKVEEILRTKVVRIFVDKKSPIGDKMAIWEAFNASYPAQLNRAAEKLTEAERTRDLDKAKLKDEKAKTEFLAKWNKENYETVKKEYIKAISEDFDSSVLKDYIDILAIENKPVETKK